jgi:glyoxylase-like metal-dependent hydrolase (beta-lactamase superfamily II)
MGHQSMFIVTPKGVIATDPIARYRPQAATTYLDEIKKVTNQPVKYLIYSHAHWDHIAGAKPFKDAGARIVAHKNVKTRFEMLKKQGNLLDSVLMPDETVDQKKTISLGGTTLELNYVGRNHSDSSLVMRLPKEKLIFLVDFIPIEGVQFRNIPDNASPVEYEESIKKVVAMDWERMIPGHPYAGGRLGTKKDAEDHLAYMQDLSAAVKKAAPEGKCIDTAMKEIKLPKYEKWANYETALPMNIERYCYWWSNGY